MRGLAILSVVGRLPLVGRRPYAAGFVLVCAVYWILTLSFDFTFLADDWVHLAAAERVPRLYADHFSAWSSRLPVWSALAWGIFASHVFERTWALMYAAFAAHAGAVALLVRWLVRELPGPGDPPPPRPVIVAAAIGTATLYPNVYEILYWPTCMPYALGGLLMVSALYLRFPPARTVVTAAAFLTYETFVLPSLTLMLAPAVLRPAGPNDAPPWRRILRAAAPWLAAVLIMLTVRALAAKIVGSFEHSVRLAPSHVLGQVAAAAKQLFQIRFLRSGTNELATAGLWAAGIGAIVLLWRRWRWRLSPAALLVACFTSTAVYWILDYNAMRAIYGAQVLLAGLLGWLWIHASRTGVQTGWTGVALGLVAAGFMTQTLSVLRIKDHNAQVLAAREAELRAQIERCERTCSIEYDDLDRDLVKDWVLPRDYWDSYFERLRLAYGRDKGIVFVPAAAAGAPALRPSASP